MYRPQLSKVCRTIAKRRYITQRQEIGLNLLNILLRRFSKFLFRKYIPIKTLFLSIGQYTIVSSSTAVFILGGKADWGNTSKVARFQNLIWKQIANLKFARHGHRALKYGDLVMIVGGWATADK